jgi:hypothetical protein
MEVSISGLNSPYDALLIRNIILKHLLLLPKDYFQSKARQAEALPEKGVEATYLILLFLIRYCISS